MANNENPCVTCPYRWKDEGDDWATCHWVEEYPGDKAPCEYDEVTCDEDCDEEGY